MQSAMTPPNTYQPGTGAWQAIDAGSGTAPIPLSQYKIIRRSGASYVLLRS